MRYIDSWLTGLGLEYIIPKLKANGITTPKKLALLTLRDMYEVVGVEDAEDRKKLYFLIQRLHTILNNKNENPGSPGSNEDEDETLVEKPSATKSPTERKSMRGPTAFGDEVVKQVGADRSTEEDLRVLRRNRRTSVDNAPSPKQSLNLDNLHAGAVPYEIKSVRRGNGASSDDITRGVSEISLKEKTAPPSNRRAPQQEEPREVPALSARNMRAEQQQQQPVSRSVRATKQQPVSPPASPPRAPPPQQPVGRPVSTKLPSQGKVPLPPSFDSMPQKSGSRASAPKPVPQEEYLYDDYSADDNHGIEDMAIRVVVRKRPMSRGELSKGDRDVMDIEPGGKVLVHEPKTKVDLTKVIETQSFTFDDAFEAEETNEVIYGRTIRHLVQFVFDGGKASCFAYGQTGSGKTFSMMGSRPDAPAEATVNAGLYVLAARDIFSMVRRPQFKHIKVLVSCFEIYGGKLFDLLNERGVVKCLEDAKQQVQLPGLTEHLVQSVGELLDLMAMAHTQRSTGSTGANAESSRSHQIMQIVLRDGTPVPKHTGRGPAPVVIPKFPGGKLSFIDLAGSERGADTTHNSKQTRMEGAEINTSLLALKEVIRSLERKHGHTPFRGSKLTQVLKDSFVGDKTRTCMVACVSPSHSNCEHTLNTLRYADRVKEHQSGGNNDKNAHVSSSQYDSMAYDYVPPSKAQQQQQQQSDRPHTANSAVSSRGGPAVPAPKQPPLVKSNSAKSNLPSSSRSRPVADRSDAEDSQNTREPVVSRALSSAVDKRVREPESRTNPSSKIPSATDAARLQHQQREAAAKKAQEEADLELERRRQSAAKRMSLAAEKEAKDLQIARLKSQAKQAAKHRHVEEEDSSNYDDPRQTQHRPQKPASKHHHSSHSHARFDREVQEDSEDAEVYAHDEDVTYDAIYHRNTAAGYAPAVDLDEEEEDRHSRGQKNPVRGGRNRAPTPSDEEDEADEEEEDQLNGSTELIQRTVVLLSAHKQSIAEMVEVMKEEMELVQDMENVDERDSELYLHKLDSLLAAKSAAIDDLRGELTVFQKYRAVQRHRSRY